MKPINPRQWLKQTGLSWLRALEDEAGFAESVIDGVAVRGMTPTHATQSRLGYCWSHLALLFPNQSDFAKAAEKSFRLEFPTTAADAGFRVYDQSFFLLFMAWYFRLSGDETALRRLKDRYSRIEKHLDHAGVGGFGPQPAGMRSHNPYMHLLEALLAAFRHTQDEYWLAQALSIEDLFFTRLLDKDKRLVFEFLNSDWSVVGEGRVEIGHQLEWPGLLLQLHEITGKPELRSTAGHLSEFAFRHGFEDGLAIDAVDANGNPFDRRKLLWVQTEAARRLSGERAAEHWKLIRWHFFHANGWSWYNRLTADSTPIEEPSNARLLYHVVTAAAEIT
jgi:mannose/cellobiose epimerase-like protein (N-acyl-D-glucosamine 2-epimerase family)